ncbi:hypothetical protein [Vibrio ezurae]|uniref:Uncharacterized protein n=1 Tax=Vibrio ezurae NBRC 102218 TaxID=1219080 RepID=U3B4I8_9VIBR|nr:hypothetical protein [Vibrio ezurae]GAD80845.1 hypothetical protein VEZ01S_44_00480 [Vibrio ezurae NBRC 102218]
MYVVTPKSTALLEKMNGLDVVLDVNIEVTNIDEMLKEGEHAHFLVSFEADDENEPEQYPLGDLIAQAMQTLDELNEGAMACSFTLDRVWMNGDEIHLSVRTLDKQESSLS